MVEKISTNTITGVSPTLKDQGTKEQIKVKPEEKQKETKKTEKAKSGTKQSANTQVSAAATTSSVNVTQENSVQAPATNPEANLAPSGGAGENTATVVISEDVKKENAIYRLLIKWVGNNQEKEVELRKDLEDGKLSWDEAQKLGMTKQAFNLLSVGGAVNKVKKNGTVKGAGYITAEDAEKFQKGTIEDIAKGTNQEGAVIGAYLTANKFAVVNKGEAVRRFNGSSLKGAGAKTLLDSITDLNIKAAATSILKNLGKEATDDTALNDKELGAFLITLSFLGQLKDDERARIMLEAKSLGKPSSASTEDYLVWVFPGAKDWESVKGGEAAGYKGDPIDNNKFTKVAAFIYDTDPSGSPKMKENPNYSGALDELDKLIAGSTLNEKETIQAKAVKIDILFGLAQGNIESAGKDPKDANAPKFIREANDYLVEVKKLAAEGKEYYSSQNKLYVDSNGKILKDENVLVYQKNKDEISRYEATEKYAEALRGGHVLQVTDKTLTLRADANNKASNPEIIVNKDAEIFWIEKKEDGIKLKDSKVWYLVTTNEGKTGWVNSSSVKGCGPQEEFERKYLEITNLILDKKNMPKAQGEFEALKKEFNEDAYPSLKDVYNGITKALGGDTSDLTKDLPPLEKKIIKAGDNGRQLGEQVKEEQGASKNKQNEIAPNGTQKGAAAAANATFDFTGNTKDPGVKQ